MKIYRSLFSVLLLSLAITGISPAPASAMDQQEVEKIIQEYIRNHPEEVAAAMQKFQVEQRRAQEEAELKQALANRVEAPVGDSPTQGPANAPLTIVEFSDFQCPYCANSVGTIHTLMQKYAGKVRLVFKHTPLPFHDKAPAAHKASMAANEQGKFWEFRQILMATQKDWEKEENGKAKFITYAKQLGMDAARFEKDMDNPKYQSALEEDMALAKKLGVRGTPTYFLNGARVVGARGLDYFEKVISQVANDAAGK
ncbi:MAG: DsbA family protein [Nitrospinota bacterium]|nr:DsbA family protein [Nitrospinota bacterium]